MTKHETKRYDLADVVSVTTGRLVTPRHMDGMYDILNWMTNDNLFTHQLPRAAEECQPWLRRWFPGLKAADDAVPSLKKLLRKHAPEVACGMWIDSLIAGGLSRTYDVPRIPRDDHEQIDAYDEMVRMRGSDDGIVLVQSPESK